MPDLRKLITHQKDYPGATKLLRSARKHLRAASSTATVAPPTTAVASTAATAMVPPPAQPTDPTAASPPAAPAAVPAAVAPAAAASAVGPTAAAPVLAPGGNSKTRRKNKKRREKARSASASNVVNVTFDASEAAPGPPAIHPAVAAGPITPGLASDEATVTATAMAATAAHVQPSPEVRVGEDNGHTVPPAKVQTRIVETLWNQSTSRTQPVDGELYNLVYAKWLRDWVRCSGFRGSTEPDEDALRQLPPIDNMPLLEPVEGAADDAEPGLGMKIRPNLTLDEDVGVVPHMVYRAFVDWYVCQVLPPRPPRCSA